jgi:hypothetical protein
LRKNGDSALLNENGRRLLQLCQASGLRLCNGRSVGDPDGAGTSFGTNSVVDYFAVSCQLLSWVLQMRVLQQHAAAYSDHATLQLELSLPAPPEQRLCSRCGNGVETVQHMIFDCPRYASLRARFSDLFCLLPEPCTLHAFLQPPPARLANFAASLKLQWQVAHDAAALP